MVAPVCWVHYIWPTPASVHAAGAPVEWLVPLFQVLISCCFEGTDCTVQLVRVAMRRLE